MAPLSKSLALAGTLFAAFGSAAPVEKRSTEVVYQTVTSVVWTTVDVTTTIYGAAPTSSATATPTPDAQYQLPGNSQPEQSVNYQPSSSTTSTSTVWWTPEPHSWTTSASTSTSTSESEPAWTPSTTSSVEAWTPATTSESEPAWTPSTTSQWEPAWTPSTTTTVPAAATTSASSSGSSGSSSGYSGSCSAGSPCTGDLTYYVAGLGSCGTTSNGNSDKVVALPVGLMTNSYCGKTVKITYNGKTDYGTVLDKCMGCNDVSIDLSEKLFETFGTMAEGRLTGAEWSIL
ncbi:hypothetical protein AbraIFM66950_003009 [Aspergillus brasiliensis]|nr:hypothetical protein AbraIFM66950_003009 [Aspergillus brasiliensis]